jgi:transposase InsO family protein
VPATHLVDIKLPAVSGSSGHLVIERPIEDNQEPSYPGRIFANTDLSYAEAMRRFVADSAPISGPRKAESSEKSSKRAKTRQLRLEQADLCAKRRGLRQTRHAEDTAWKKQRDEIRQKPPELDQPKLRAKWGSGKEQAEKCQFVREQRRQQLDLRKQEDQQWCLDRQNLREKTNLLPLVSAWIAILLVTDNCSRQCLGLPLFIAGSHVTAEMVITALRALLPASLQFLISDRGIHFIAKVFQQLAIDENFVHVLIARHRPQSNGIAERFVRTVKEWLADKTWASDEELLILLDTFLLEYNDRPHQGLPTPGLSPNEYARRLQLPM